MPANLQNRMSTEQYDSSPGRDGWTTRAEPDLFAYKPCKCRQHARLSPAIRLFLCDACRPLDRLLSSRTRSSDQKIIARMDYVGWSVLVGGKCALNNGIGAKCECQRDNFFGAQLGAGYMVSHSIACVPVDARERGPLAHWSAERHAQPASPGLEASPCPLRFVPLVWEAS